jgi:prevent-host-death family protein
MDVAVSVLRAELSSWIEKARAGEEVVVTDRGVPVARLLSVDAAPLLERLTQSGALSKPRVAARPSARASTRVRASGPVSDLVGEQRR